MKYLLYKGTMCVLTVFLDEGVIKEIKFGHTFGECEQNDDPKVGIDIVTQLDEYFSGLLKEFSLDAIAEGTEFQKSVWMKLRDIPYGETRTYAQIAEELGRPKSARAVGGACNRNPIPIIIPCHRVIGADGKLTGYAGGVDLKQKLLALEENYC